MALASVSDSRFVPSVIAREVGLREVLEKTNQEALLAWLRVGARRSPLLEQFAIQAAGWGIVDAIIAVAMLLQIAPRDIASATRLDRILWLNIGLDAGYVLVGLTLIMAGWRMGRRRL